MFAYPCPFCTQRLLASPERIGQRTICPKCLKPIVIARPEAAAPLSGELSVAELLSDPSPSTIFAADDLQHSDDEADAMDLSLPSEYNPDLQTSIPEYSPLPPLSDAEMETAGATAASLLGILPMAYGGGETAFNNPTPAPAPAPMHLGGVGAGPSAYAPPPYGPTTAAPFPTARPSTSTPTPIPKDNGVVVFHATSGESADIAAELTTNLTMRMKPPPEPPSDLRLTTGLWLLLSATGLSLWLLSAMSPERQDNENFLLTCVKYIGALELVISYIWVAYSCGRKDTNAGLAALVPPVWVYHLFHPVWQQGYRPLRYAVMGVVLLALAYGTAALRPYVHRIIGPSNEVQQEVPSPLATPLARLKNPDTQSSSRQLLEALRELSQDKLTFADAPAEKPELIAELRRLRTNENSDVRAASLIALKKWAGLEAIKPDVLAVLRAKNADDRERTAAMDVAREYKDKDITKAVAARVGFRGFNDDSFRAADTLRAIGRPEAEDALLALFEDEDLLIRGLPTLLADPKIGGAKSVTVLTALSTTSTSREVRDQAARTAKIIAANLNGDKKPE
ncbi:hypothetical protein BH11PLA2_BH11PLA2_33240 [soil metagenome]